MSLVVYAKEYDLCSVVVHIENRGRNAIDHYICFLKRNDKWWKYDDRRDVTFTF